jgi:hypothetical protein
MPWIELFWSKILKGYNITIPKPRRKAIPFFGLFANTMGLLKGYCITRTKPQRNAIPPQG